VPEEVTDDGVLVSQSKITVSQVWEISWRPLTHGVKIWQLTTGFIVVSRMRGNMPSQPDLHPPLPEFFQLDLEPVKLERSWIRRAVFAPVDHYSVSLGSTILSRHAN
jgi:hypothetical protein